MSIYNYMESHTRFSFVKGDLLLLHLDKGEPFHLLVIHVIREREIFYCWDINAEVYRVISKHPMLHLLCPQFDPDFPSDLDWSNEWVLGLYLRKFDLAGDTDDF